MDLWRNLRSPPGFIANKTSTTCMVGILNDLLHQCLQMASVIVCINKQWVSVCIFVGMTENKQMSGQNIEHIYVLYII